MQPKILFYKWTFRTNKRGLSPIYCRLTLSGKRVQFSTNIFLASNQWNSNKQQVQRHTLASELNLRLSSIKNIFILRYLELARTNEPITLDKLVEVQKPKKKYTVIDVFKEYLDLRQGDIGENYSKNTFKTLKNSYNLFVKLIGLSANAQILIADLNADEWNVLISLAKQNGYSINSINKYFKILKQVINYAVSKSYIEKNKIGHLKLPKQQTEIVVLNDLELSLLESYGTSRESYEHVRDCFLFSCYTGLAYNEIKEFRYADIEIEGKNNWINVARIKTGKSYQVPILSKAQLILDKYKALGKLPVISNQKYNDYIKEICTSIGIKKKVTSHVARKTFATTILLNNGVPMEIVSKLLGHSSIAITESSYAKVSKSLILESIMKVK